MDYQVIKIYMSTNSFENTKITELDRQRYLRQMRLTEIGELGQVKLKKSSILIIGAGGLGSPAALLFSCGWSWPDRYY